jgi:hypothetical protein
MACVAVSTGEDAFDPGDDSFPEEPDSEQSTHQTADEELH